jgi:hypothetical protein
MSESTTGRRGAPPFQAVGAETGDGGEEGRSGDELTDGDDREGDRRPTEEMIAEMVEHHTQSGGHKCLFDGCQQEFRANAPLRDHWAAGGGCTVVPEVMLQYFQRCGVNGAQICLRCKKVSLRGQCNCVGGIAGRQRRGRRGSEQRHGLLAPDQLDMQDCAVYFRDKIRDSDEGGFKARIRTLEKIIVYFGGRKHHEMRDASRTRPGYSGA